MEMGLLLLTTVVPYRSYKSVVLGKKGRIQFFP